MYGQTGAKAGLEDRNVLRQLCGAIHWHQPVYPQQTGTDSEGQELVLGDDGRLSAVPEMTEMAQAYGWCPAARPFSPGSWPHAAEPSPQLGKEQQCYLLQVPNTGLTPCVDSCGLMPAIQETNCGLLLATSCLCGIHVLTCRTLN